MKKIIFVLILIINIVQVQSNPDSVNTAFGIFFHYNINSHIADFKKLPDCPSCSPGFESGSGSGFSFGLIYELPIQENILFSNRLSYFDYSGTLNRIEKTTVMYNQKSITGEFEHNLDASLASVGLEPGLKYQLFKNFYINLFFHGGYVSKSDYSQYEKIINPKDAGSFLDSNGNDTYSRLRNVLSGKINNASSLNLAILPGLSYDLPLNNEKNITLGLEAFYSIGILPIVFSDEVKKWTVNSLRFGFTLKYSPLQKETIFRNDTLIKIDSIIIESNIAKEVEFKKGKEIIRSEVEEYSKYYFTHYFVSRTDTLKKKLKKELSCDISAVGVQEDGTETPLPYIKMEEFISNKLQPLLNYIFFEESSSLLQNKYIKLNRSQTKQFDENKLFQDSVLGVYYHILNIIGSRMKRYPKAVLRLVGCNDGYTSEKNNLELSRKRAETLKEYFIKVWDIEQERLKTEARNLPEKPSTPIEQFEKIEENRRVELLSDEYEIVKPIFMSDTVRIAEIPKIRFRPKVNQDVQIKNWMVFVRQKEDTLRTWQFKGALNSFDWDFTKEPNSMPRYNYPIIYKLFIEDQNSDKASTLEKFIEIDNISVSQKRNEKRRDIVYEKYSLILFDFNKSDISWTNSKIIDFIKTRLKNESIVNITGHTDKTGDDDYNLKLSEARAKKTLEVIGKKDATAQGFGEQNLLYNNNLPEGRFYCRTVNIEVETPVR
jgi:outer membrane protein OmpA-like peptidoglycan-associated protein